MAKILLTGMIAGQQLTGERPEYPTHPEQLADSFLHRLLRRAKRFHHPDLVITGGIVADTPETEQCLYKELADSQLPFLVAPKSGEPPREQTVADITVTVDAVGIRVQNAAGWNRIWRWGTDRGKTGENLPPLMQAPFIFLLLETDGAGGVVLRQEQLRLPEGLHLRDLHNHTPYAYCCENMTVPRAVAMGRWVGLEGMTFTEHTLHLFFSRTACLEKVPWRRGLAATDQNLAEAYFRLCREQGDGFARAGLEIDIDWQGKLVVPETVLERSALRLAAVHSLPEQAGTMEEKRLAFLGLTEAHLRQKPDILAHPFRVLRGEPEAWTATLWQPVAELLARYGVAAELNFHHGAPPPEFVSMCLERGVRLSFGGDSHELGMVGDFYAHLALLNRLGASSRLDEVLWRERI